MAMNRNQRRKGTQANGAPVGYGQQNGDSPFLDQPRSPESADAQQPMQMAHERNAPAAPAPSAFEETMAQAPGMPPQGDQLKMALQRQPQTAAGPAASPAWNQAQPVPDPNAPGGYNSFEDPRTAQQPVAQPQAPQAGGLASAVQTARANNFSDIAGAEGIAAGNFQGQLEGFGNIDPGGERGSNTHKKLFGRIASRYDVTQPGAVRTLMQDPDFLSAFPDAKLVEHPNADLIDFGDGNPVDVIRAAEAGGAGQGWQWGVGGGQPQPQAMGAPQGGVGGPGGDQLSAMLMAALQGGGGDQFGAGSVNIQQLLEALGLQQQAGPLMGGGGQPQF